MNWEAVGAVGELLGAAGVIVSLSYLAVQIRGDARAKRAQTVHQQSGAFRDFLRMVAHDSELTHIYLRGLRDIDSLSDEEWARFTSHLGYLFRVYEENFFQWREGHLDPNIWHGYEAPVDDILAYPGARAWWTRRGHWFSPAFREFIEAKVAKPGVPSMYGESTGEGGGA